MSKIFTIADALESLCPGTQWSIQGNDPDRITWHTQPATTPTREALLGEVARLRDEASRTAYRELRAREYPPMGDYLDAVVKGDQAQIDAYIAACLAVKAKYPKP